MVDGVDHHDRRSRRFGLLVRQVEGALEVDVFRGGGRVRVGLLVGPGGGRVDGPADLLADACDGVGVEQPGLAQLNLQAHDGVHLPVGFELFGGAVLFVVVGGGVGQQAHHVRHEADGPAAAADVLERRPGHGVGLEEVRAVDAGAFQAFIAAGELVGGAAGRLFGDGDGDGVLVVLHDEEHRRPGAGRPVEGFVEVALGGGAVSARTVDVGVVVGLAEQAQAHADGRQELGADGGRDGQDVALPVAVVLGHLPPAAVGVVGLGQVGQQHLLGRTAQAQVHRQVPVIEAEPVVARAGEQPDGGLGGLVPGTADVKEPFALLEQAQHLLVEQARGEHPAVDRQQGLGLEVVRGHRLDLEVAFVGGGRRGRADAVGLEGRFGDLARRKRFLSVPLLSSCVSLLPYVSTAFDQPGGGSRERSTTPRRNPQGAGGVEMRSRTASFICRLSPVRSGRQRRPA
ncbi:MAG: hypothetical protein KatS3mg043_1766 [Rhodothermaceae bacterium]|nr:MAG: hypothetical protein KatS3mg043_1766 [Rhodothermaceae bacterium]